MKRIHNFSFLTFCLIFFLVSCNETTGNEVAQFYDLGDTGILANDQFIFYPFQDSTKFLGSASYSIDISVRYSKSCSIKYLPLNIEYGSLESDSIVKKKIDISLFDDSDRIKGNGNFGVFETLFPVLNNQKYEDGFFLALESTDTINKGIISLGVIVKK